MFDVEVADKCIVVESSARQCVCASWQDDGIGADGEVGLHDGGAQSAGVIDGFADAVRWIDVGQIRRVVYGIGARNDWQDKSD